MSYLSDSILDRLRSNTDRPDLTGTRYELGEVLGRGGMGAVYSARDTILDRTVALKVLDSAERDPAASRRLLEEAKLAARLEHPGIVPIYDAGTLADGRVYYAMKLVRGQRLDALHADLPARLRVFLKVCEAVAFAHSAGVIHRDLKPANIMTGSFGEVLTMDWGVARRFSETSAPAAGTPRYMAPEQTGNHDHRVDIYALGVMLTDLLPSPAPRPLLAIAAKASTADPAARYATALDLAADIERFLEKLPVSAYRESLPERAVRFAQRNAILLLLLAAYVLVRLVFLLARNIR